MVAPALARYTLGPLFGDPWKRADLSQRDRRLITVAALIARHQTIRMPYHVNLALDNGVRPSEISEVITHLAFYSGWANATSAVAVANDVFAQRGIGADELPPASGPLLSLDEAAEARRAARVGEIAMVGVAPAITNAIFHATGRRIRELPATPDKLL